MTAVLGIGVMGFTRRSFVIFSLCAAAGRALGQQGVASRDLKAQPAPTPSGRPFNARFTDIAETAGLRSPVIYGGVESKKYTFPLMAWLRSTQR